MTEAKAHIELRLSEKSGKMKADSSKELSDFDKL